MAFRMNFVGELGWELHHPIEYQNHIFDAIMAAGRVWYQAIWYRAMDAMRLEKSYVLLAQNCRLNTPPSKADFTALCI